MRLQIYQSFNQEKVCEKCPLHPLQIRLVSSSFSRLTLILLPNDSQFAKSSTFQILSLSLSLSLSLFPTFTNACKLNIL